MTFDKGLILALAFLSGAHTMAVATDLRDGRRPWVLCVIAAAWAGALAGVLSL